ncbi:MAG: FxsA family protein [Rhodobacteraceae bacterium]|nr:FxsA family protein [Paracoccaceae bacterium]
MWLLALFIAVPLIEIALFIQVGGAIGLSATLAIVVLTAIAGTWLVRSQVIMEMEQLRDGFRELLNPTESLAHGAMILFSGALLLTPGFFTDAVGFALLVPSVRSAVFRYLRSRFQVQGFSMGASTAPPRRENPRGDVVEGEFKEVSAAKTSTRGNSGWTRH